MRAKKAKRGAQQYPALTEPQLRAYAEHKAIKAVQALRTNKYYELLVYMHFNPQPLILHTQRKYPRAWVSLDRFAAYIERMLPKIKGFEVVYNKGVRDEPD